ncbi:glycosyltransferase [Undibacterium sp. SXout7W]|uniref:glycosyltransferase n=1 Tax=Undibacterium sp. SXout7W TaxID=3413049 RepID=UPI003BF40B16
MRIVIDLQHFQSKAKIDLTEMRSITQLIAHLSISNDVLIVLNSYFGDAISSIRQVFKKIIPDKKIVVFDVPDFSENTNNLVMAGSWKRQAAENIRSGFLASLSPDIVFAPYLLEAENQNVIRAIVPALSQYETVFLVSDAIIPLLSKQDERFYRLQFNLNQASLILTTSEKTRDKLAQITQRYPQYITLSDHSQFISVFSEILPQHLPRKPPRRKEKLAFISPLPPERSGIADYSAELLRELVIYYDVELILDQVLVSDPWIQSNLRMRSIEWFKKNADEFEHVLYQIGNSPAHKHMFELLEQHPGVVVLHDFFLANVIDYLDHYDKKKDAFSNALYYSHGLQALLDQKNIGKTETIWKYPCNKKVLDKAKGIIVHSNFPRKLAEQWYGNHYADAWITIPLLRGERNHVLMRKTARDVLHINNSDFLVCSFGLMGFTKCNEELLDAWLASSLAKDPHCKLVFVGANDGGSYGERIASKINSYHAEDNITITGFVTHEIYSSYLIAADAAVQLRTQTRGETSASVLDCLLHGLPTIVNAHGSMDELPEDILIKLEDTFSTESLSTALENLRNNPVVRKQLSFKASSYIQSQHSPKQIGAQYYEAIEHFHTVSQYRYQQQVIKNISLIGAPSDQEWSEATSAIAKNHPETNSRQLLIDITALVQTDLKTGIQRVVRSIILALLHKPPRGYRIEPVYSMNGSSSYYYARTYLQNWLGCPIPGNEDAQVEIHQDDIFLGLDLLISRTKENRDVLQQYKNHGAHIYFVVYDLLPVLKPESFPAGTDIEFHTWLHTVTHISDGLVCISKSVLDEVLQWTQLHQPKRADAIKLGYFHLGADINASSPSSGLTPDADKTLHIVRSRPSMLMVGTIEPRKGHRQTLDAFELLWAQGIEVNLVIIGKQGWMIDDLAQRLLTHPEAGKRLVWLQNASDEMLLSLYQASSALIAASEGEGFGLPLIEAAQHKLPIIARDLPVFKEVMGIHAHYFHGLSGNALAEGITTWLSLQERQSVPQSEKISWLTWEESAVQLLNCIVDQQWPEEFTSTQYSDDDETAQIKQDVT